MWFWLVLLVAVCAPRASSVSLKSVQVWSEKLEVNGNTTWATPHIYAQTVEVAGSVAAAARAPIGTWTFIGCYEASDLSATSSGLTPQTCVAACDVVGRIRVAAVQGSSCYCLGGGRLDLGPLVSEELCQTKCPADYFSGISRQCGGEGKYFSVYEKYTFTHQTAQGCYDPRRFIWYQSVAIEVIKFNATGVESYAMEWYLHAASINSGEPLFPYHRPLDEMHLGLQYDLDSSRIIGYTLPYWGSKPAAQRWAPSVRTYRILSKDADISFSMSQVPFAFETGEISQFQLSNGISAVDALHDIYYVTMPSIPQVPGFDDPRFYTTRLHGINLNTNEDILNGRVLEQSVVLLEVNAQTHELFALLKEENADLNEDSSFYYVRLGKSYRSNASTSTLAVLFDWTFGAPTVNHVINPYSYTQFINKVYQVGATAVDHVSNTSFVVMRDSANAIDPIYIQDMNQEGLLRTEDFAPLESPTVQGTWLLNTDPIIPLSLPAPKLQSARFSIDGRSIIVSFDSYTVEGALPIDLDGDDLPDNIDWSKRQIGLRNCSDMFARRTAALLGSMPDTYCEWRSGTTIQIHLRAGSTDVSLGTGLFLKDTTIYAYIAEGPQWSMAASGGIAVSLPDPLDPPKIVISWNKYVDLCSPVTLNAQQSYRHGDQPAWVWSLSEVKCLDDREPDADTTATVRGLMADNSVGGLVNVLSGTPIIDFTKDGLEPGCTYFMSLNLTGRWGLTSTEHITVSKQAVPAPKVALQNSRDILTTRNKVLTLQAQVQSSVCETLFTEKQVLKFVWSGVTESVNPHTGATEQKPIEDLTLLASRINSASLLVPRFRLEPQVKYTFSIKAGYESTFDVPGASTIEDATVLVGRSPIKVNILGGGRVVQKSSVIALDLEPSIDPDFPDDLVQVSSSWTFAYACTTPEGIPCFPLRADTGNLSDIRDCELSSYTFMDLGKEYEVPVFSTEELKSESYYCKHPTKVGVLILNLPNENALAGGPTGDPSSYTFTIWGFNAGRTARATVNIGVVASESGGAHVPEVVIGRLPTAKSVTTQRLKVVGELTASDKARYGDNVKWAWSFFRKEPNPKYSLQAAVEAETKGEPYLLPKDVYIEAIELDRNQSDQFALTSLYGNSLVLKAFSLRPSSTYAFRLTATVPHPIDAGVFVSGFGALEVITAGPPPVPGELFIFPENESAVDVEKVLTARSWTAEDTPLMYMFSYRSDPDSNFSEPIDLRVNPVSASEQRVWCMRVGPADKDYRIEVFVTAYSLYGASTTLRREYRVLPSQEIAATNRKIRQKAEEVDPESVSQILACHQIPPLPVQTVATGTNATQGTTTTTLQPIEDNDAAEAAVVQESNALVSLLRSSAKEAVVTPASITSNLQATSTIASGGIVTEEVLGFVGELVDSAVSLLPNAESDEERDALAGMVFNTLGTLAIGAANPRFGKADRPTGSFNAANARTGMFFPATSTKPVEQGVLQVASSRFSSGTSGGRRLQDGGDGSYSVNEGAYPQWTALPDALRDPIYYGDNRVSVLPVTTVVNETTGEVYTQWADMFSAQEGLEREWAAYVNATEAQNLAVELDRVRDDELFANYTANLDPVERETVLRQWWEEKARTASTEQSRLFSRSQQTQQMMQQVGTVCASMLHHMVNQEKKEFPFPMGKVRFGKSRDLQAADATFTVKDPKWNLPAETAGSYGWQSVEFTEMNPLAWSPSSPTGPFLVTTLDLYNADGAHLQVNREAVPLDIMADHSSFASAACAFWDWEANGGLGGWATTGLLNGENGCSTTHLSIVGMFLDVSAPLIELPSAVELFLDDNVNVYNIAVAIAVGAVLALNGVLHYWGHKQDESDQTKPLEMKRLGDGIKGPRSQDDPVDYSSMGVLQALGTFANLMRRDHLLLACFFRCEKMRVTRLQKASVNFAAIAGTAAVAALLYGERVVDPKHFVEVGMLAATLTYPAVGALATIFQIRPVALESSPVADPSAGPLEAMPVPEDEDEEEDVAPAQPVGLPLGALMPPLPPPRRGDAPEAGAGPSGMVPPPPPPRSAAQRSPGVPSLQLSPPTPASVPSVPPSTASPRLPLPPGPPERSSASGSGASADLPTLPGGMPSGVLPPAPPVPPARGPQSSSEQLAAEDTGGGVLAVLPAVVLEDHAAAQTALSISQAQLLKRVRRMYIENTMHDSDRAAYDERVDMKMNISHPAALLVNAIAHTAVAMYWTVATALAVMYAVYFVPAIATRWAYSCISGWIFTWFVLEFVKVALSAIIEMSQLNQRKLLSDPAKLKARIFHKTERKKKQMEAKSNAAGAMPKMHSLLPRPPLPPDAPPGVRPGEQLQMLGLGAPPALGDASAG